MPSKGHQKREPVSRRLKVGLTDAQLAELTRRADAAQTTLAGYVRALVELDLGQRASMPAARRRNDALNRLGEIHSLAVQIKRIGTNINQMARQVNTGMVPLTARELNSMRAQVSIALDLAIALFERERAG